jgi:hypothetical protein
MANDPERKEKELADIESLMRFYRNRKGRRCASALAMLSDQEKLELLEAADSSRLRDDFRALRRNTMSPPSQPSTAELLDFLTCMSRLAGEPFPEPSRSFHKMLL